MDLGSAGKVLVVHFTQHETGARKEDPGSSGMLRKGLEMKRFYKDKAPLQL